MAILNHLIKYSIYVLVFLVPLFFLPFSFEALEYNKQYLLFFLVSIGFFAWLAKMVLVDKEIRFRRTPLDLFVLAFLFVAILSAIFSVDKSSSLFGFYGRFSNGLIGLLSLGLLYFLITNNVNREENVSGPRLRISGLLKTLLWSSFFVVLMSYLLIFGVLAKMSNLLPRITSQITFNPVAGSLEGLSIFLAMMVVLVVGVMLGQKASFGPKGFGYWLLLIPALFLLLMIDFTAAWLILLVSLVLFVGFSLWKRIFRENVNRLLIPIFLIAVAGACIFLQPQKIIFGTESVLANLPQEQILNQRTSWGIGFDSATDNIKSGLLGSGIGTFHYDFAKEKPLGMNQTWLWQIRFDRAGSYLAEILATMGFLGILSYLALIGLFLLISYFALRFLTVGEGTSLTYQLPLLMVFIALLVGQFVYYQNTTLAFVFWLVMGLSVISWQRPMQEKIISLKSFPELSLVFSTVVMVLGVGLLVMYFFAGKFYLADTKYMDSIRMETPTTEERINLLTEAINLNPYQPSYRLILGKMHFYRALAETRRPVVEQDSNRFVCDTSLAIAYTRGGRVAKRCILPEALPTEAVVITGAAELNPNWVAVWETAGMIYREFRGIAGAVDWGIKSFETAIVLEPTNPVLYTELGKLYWAINDTEKAKESFNKAIEKKSDYVDGLFQLALLLEREDILDEAVEKLESAEKANPFDIEVLFQLGRLYFNNNQIDKAISQFNKVIILEPNHPNAHYSLGVAYIVQGEKTLAIEEFEKVLELTPGSQDVIQKLEQLRE